MTTREGQRLERPVLRAATERVGARLSVNLTQSAALRHGQGASRLPHGPRLQQELGIEAETPVVITRDDQVLRNPSDDELSRALAVASRDKANQRDRQADR